MRSEEAVLDARLHARVRRGLRHPPNWFQLVRFGVVGASGYAVNLAVFAVAVHGLAIDYRIAAVLAFSVALANNFIWNRHWTFRAGDGHAGWQAARFLVVSLAAFAFVNLLVLQLLVVEAAMPKVPAQALAVAAATPLNFLCNRLWSFRA
jgi:dolichol-phosphate mannosyltransferase